MQGTRARLRLTVLSLCVLGWILDAKQPLQAQENGVSASEILIGGIGALTGPFAFIGALGRDGLTLGFNEINQQNVCGRKIRLLFDSIWNRTNLDGRLVARSPQRWRS